MKDMLKMINFDFGFIENKIVDEDWNFTWEQNVFQYQYHRMYYILDGEGEIYLKNNKKITILPGYLYLIPGYSILKTICKKKMNQFFIHFKCSFPIFNTLINNLSTFSIKATDETFLMISKITQINTFNFHSDMQKYGLFLLLLSDFLKYTHTDIYSSATTDFLEILDYIEINYNSQISVTYLAKKMGYNTVYFSNKFKKVFSVTPLNYLINKRLENAQRLLIETNLSISDIAYNVGFLNESYFIKYFKKTYKITPFSFRKLK